MIQSFKNYFFMPKESMTAFEHLILPEFEKKEFLRTPQNKLCPTIDATRLMVEILWGLSEASGEFSESQYASKLILDGKYALVLRYKREKDGKYHPACTLWFDTDDFWNIQVNQLQWSKDKHIAFRFHSSYNSLAYYLQVLEETFLKKWIYVWVEAFPEWLEGAAYSSNAHQSYHILRTALEGLNKKYGLEKKS